METYTIMKEAGIDRDSGLPVYEMVAHRIPREEIEGVLEDDPTMTTHPEQFYIFKNTKYFYSLEFNFSNEGEHQGITKLVELDIDFEEVDK